MLQRAVRIRTVHNSNIAEQQKAGAFSAVLPYRYADSGTCGAFCLDSGKRQCISLFMFALFLFLYFFSRLCLSFCEALEGSRKEKDAVCQICFVSRDRESPFIASFAFVVRQPPAADHKYKAGDPHPSGIKRVSHLRRRPPACCHILPEKV